MAFEGVLTAPAAWRGSGGTAPRRLALAGLAALVAALACCLLDPRGALTGWLGAAVLFQALPLTGVTLLAMMNLLRGQWDTELRGPSETAARLWPLAAAAFVPVLLGIPAIYGWSEVKPDSAFAAAWLAPVPFALRTGLWFVLLALAARALVSRTCSARTSGLALVGIVLGASITASDWLMSLDPRFHSSAFGIQLLALETGAGFIVLALARLLRAGGAARAGLLGAILLTVLMLWAYFQFLPYLVIWSGNLPDGAAWYMLRARGGWGVALWTFIALDLLPLLAMLVRPLRTRRGPVLAALVVALAGKAVEFAWFALPGTGPVAVPAYVAALLGFAAIAGSALMPPRRAEDAA